MANLWALHNHLYPVQYLYGMLYMYKMNGFLEEVTSYYLENLPEPLLGLFIPQERIALNSEEMHAFASRMGTPKARRRPDTGALLISMGARIAEALRSVENKAFIRLGSCSPKDTICHCLPCSNVPDFFDIMFFSARVLQDVHWAFLYDYPVSLYVRPWMTIDKWQEFRCIVRQGRVHGISQYYVYNNPHYSEIENNPYEISQEIYEFLGMHVLEHSRHSDYVCDVIYNKGNIRLVDYNPMSQLTGMCYFSPYFSTPKEPEFRFQSSKGVAAIRL